MQMRESYIYRIGKLRGVANLLESKHIWRTNKYHFVVEVVVYRPPSGLLSFWDKESSN
ncbi:hypothetical protein SAMN05192573_110119 [Mucilaginibacter gossypii]|uniref:Uncharacterized protein n=1 Tax=Mucilaginibacter gossypii TaxID=551996 RepID=A0A1G8D469_9SPHI|nr:hypothetical protein SAMN05192573_110119 [Mucilaginibacter gossypii]